MKFSEYQNKKALYNTAMREISKNVKRMIAEGATYQELKTQLNEMALKDIKGNDVTLLPRKLYRTIEDKWTKPKNKSGVFFDRTDPEWVNMSNDKLNRIKKNYLPTEGPDIFALVYCAALKLMGIKDCPDTYADGLAENTFINVLGEYMKNTDGTVEEKWDHVKELWSDMGNEVRRVWGPNDVKSRPRKNKQNDDVEDADVEDVAPVEDEPVVNENPRRFLEPDSYVYDEKTGEVKYSELPEIDFTDYSDIEFVEPTDQEVDRLKKLNDLDNISKNLAEDDGTTEVINDPEEEKRQAEEEGVDPTEKVQNVEYVDTEDNENAESEVEDIEEQIAAQTEDAEVEDDEAPDFDNEDEDELSDDDVANLYNDESEEGDDSDDTADYPDYDEVNTDEEPEDNDDEDGLSDEDVANLYNDDTDEGESEDDVDYDNLEDEEEPEEKPDFDNEDEEDGLSDEDVANLYNNDSEEDEEDYVEDTNEEPETEEDDTESDESDEDEDDFDYDSLEDEEPEEEAAPAEQEEEKPTLSIVSGILEDYTDKSLNKQYAETYPKLLFTNPAGQVGTNFLFRDMNTSNKVVELVYFDTVADMFDAHLLLSKNTDSYKCMINNKKLGQIGSTYYLSARGEDYEDMLDDAADQELSVDFESGKLAFADIDEFIQWVKNGGYKTYIQG